MVKIRPCHRHKPKNASESAAYEKLEALGIPAMKRGWPDFVGFVGHTLIAVEVKPDHEPLLKETQAAVLRHLARQGVPSYLFTPSGGFEPLFESPSLRALIEADKARRA